MQQQALQHVTIIDFSQTIAGSYCTKLMAGFGGNVIKIEPPGSGDRMRSAGPFFEGENGMENSIPFHWFNTGKKSVTLDIETESGLRVLNELIGKADIVVDTFPPDDKPDGLCYDNIKTIKPDIIAISITNFGHSGPYKNYQAEENVLYAMSGMMYLTGDPEKPPLAPGIDLMHCSAGLNGYLASLMALFKRNQTGAGEFVDVSIQECGADLRPFTVFNYLNLNTIPKRNNDTHMLCPWQSYPCKDGYVTIIASPVDSWSLFLEKMGLTEPEKEKYSNIFKIMQHRKEFEEILKAWLVMHDKEDIFRMGQQCGLSFGYIKKIDEMTDFEQFQSRHVFVDLEHPIFHNVRYYDAPFKASETPWVTQRAPFIGEHNEFVMCSILDYSKSDFQALHDHNVI